MNKHQQKTDQLGMNYSTASNRLRKQLMFHLAQKCGMDMCFRCGQKITNADDLSIDHKQSWLHQENARDLFWDDDNLAFSHLSCNSMASMDKRRSLPRGVTKRKRGGKNPYQARIWEGKAKKYIGGYDSAKEAEEAIAAAVKASGQGRT